MAHGDVVLAFGDGEHTFNIRKLKQAFELQDKCGCGVGEVLTRLRAAKFYVNDFREVIRLGLIGGGMAPVAALTLVTRYVDERPWSESVMTAVAIILRAYAGSPEESLVGKLAAEQAKTEATDALPDPQSTAPAPRSGSPRAKSTK